jgi:hypothetical protein
MLYTVQVPYEPHTENVVKCILGVDLVYRSVRESRESGGHTMTRRQPRYEDPTVIGILNAPSAYDDDILHRSS